MLNIFREENFRVKYVQTTPYHVNVINVHNFRAFNFRTCHRVRKYFNNENFSIYGIDTMHTSQKAMPSVVTTQTVTIAPFVNHLAQVSLSFVSILNCSFGLV